MSGFNSGKRRFLLGAAAMAGTSVLPTWRRAHAADAYDAIIVGGGTAGLPAAIFAAERGARVLIVEKAPVLGGTLDRTGGQTTAAGTVFQKKLGIKDVWQNHYNDVMRITRDTSDPVLTRLWTENAADAVNWAADLGLKLENGDPTTGQHEPLSVPRAHHPIDQGRQYFRLFEPQVKKYQAAGKIEVLLSTKAVDLIQDNGAVVGLTIEDENGKVRDVMAKNVVLTSGGCLANARLFEELHGVPLYSMNGYPFNQGDGLTLGQSAGGFVRGGEMFCPLFGQVLADDQYPSTSIAGMTNDIHERPPWEIWVNSSGARWIAEDHPSESHKERTLGKQKSHRYWLVFDQNILEKAPELLRGWKREKYDANFGSQPMFTKAQTIHELGSRAGLNPHVLNATIADYNRGIVEGSPDAWGREFRPSQISRGPFYAIRMQGYGLLTWAGLAANHNLQIIRPDRTPVPGLYAAGEVLGKGTFGDSYCNGSGVTPAITFGRLLGKKILKFQSV